MIAVMKSSATEAQIQAAVALMKAGGVGVMVSRGSDTTILGAEGNAAGIDQNRLSQMRGVDRVMRVSEPFKMANRKYHPDDSKIALPNGFAVGGDQIALMAGPCSVESAPQITEIAQQVGKMGACALRGGAFKPRTSPYAFQGMGADGITLLMEARAETGLPIVSEIMSTNDLEMFADNVDVVQVGARNMQNFDMLKQLGQMNKPILVKRGLASTIEEWLMSAEYIMAGGNSQVMLCERGIRTFETFTRNTLDLSAVVAVKKLSHLPVIVDPSHGCGHAWMVERMAMAAVVAGADGIMVEVHNDPANALCDGKQSLTPEQFGELTTKLQAVAACVGKSIPRNS
ncbi:MAG: 3-deoxy-7-phosphoheptulonate synthase [Eubacteriales bacterium]